MRTAVRGALALATAVFAMSGCRDDAAPPVAVPGVALTATSRDGCVRLAERLPERVGDLRRRDVTEPQPGLAAYGEPALLVRCGAPRSARYSPGTPLIEINGQRWFADDQDGRVVWTLPNAIVNVEVTIPDAHKGELLATLSDAVRAAQPFG